MWSDDHRARAFHRRRVKQREHDIQVLPRIEELRRLYDLGDRRIAAILELEGHPPPRLRWSHMAVWRIRKRHGVA